MKRIAIFASGSGTNAEKIITHFSESDVARVTLLLCNNPKAGVIERSKKLNVPVFMFNKYELEKDLRVLTVLKDQKIDLIVLAGFLLKIPDYLIKSYPNKVVNIHPALLPKYGGKGMYGMHVHNAVIAAKEKNSGITVHLVNEEYDKGAILFQASCEVSSNDTPDSLAKKIHQLEHQHFPTVVASLINHP
jgi:phosphoribosylglycinamide formyltransferase-1